MDHAAQDNSMNMNEHGYVPALDRAKRDGGHHSVPAERYDELASQRAGYVSQLKNGIFGPTK
jgi:hypothetical protein